MFSLQSSVFQSSGSGFQLQCFNVSVFSLASHASACLVRRRPENFHEESLASLRKIVLARTQWHSRVEVYVAATACVLGICVLSMAFPARNITAIVNMVRVGCATHVGCGLAGHGACSVRGLRLGLTPLRFAGAHDQPGRPPALPRALLLPLHARAGVGRRVFSHVQVVGRERAAVQPRGTPQG